MTMFVAAFGRSGPIPRVKSRDRAMATAPSSLYLRNRESPRKEMAMQFWSTERRGAVEIATYANPPYNYLGQPVIDELGQLVTDWQDPDIRAVVLQSKPQGTAGFAQYSVEELSGMASDPALSRY